MIAAKVELKARGHVQIPRRAMETMQTPNQAPPNPCNGAAVGTQNEAVTRTNAATNKSHRSAVNLLNPGEFIVNMPATSGIFPRQIQSQRWKARLVKSGNDVNVPLFQEFFVELQLSTPNNIF